MDILWRLNQLIEAQRGPGRWIGLQEETAFILVAVVLNDADLAEIGLATL